MCSPHGEDLVTESNRLRPIPGRGSPPVLCHHARVGERRPRRTPMPCDVMVPLRRAISTSATYRITYGLLSSSQPPVAFQSGPATTELAGTGMVCRSSSLGSLESRSLSVLPKVQSQVDTATVLPESVLDWGSCRFGRPYLAEFLRLKSGPVRSGPSVSALHTYPPCACTVVSTTRFGASWGDNVTQQDTHST
jgi:hypothetical protein